MLTPSTCVICGVGFMVSARAIAAGKGMTCSVRCRCMKAARSRRPIPSGECSPNFKHGLFLGGIARSLAKAAHGAVRRALKRGTLIKTACVDCGDPESQAHHEDYRAPLRVVWVCFRCHRKRHGQLRSA